MRWVPLTLCGQKKNIYAPTIASYISIRKEKPSIKFVYGMKCISQYF